MVIITGISGSGKTTVQNEMIERKGYRKPFNFTTRIPRTEQAVSELNILEEDYTAEEMNEYIFISKANFGIKMGKGDFLEQSSGYGELYGVSKVLPEGNICIVLDPIGRSQIMAKVAIGELDDYNVSFIYLDIDADIQASRLRKRGDKLKQLNRRKKDLHWFHPTPICDRIDGSQTTEEILNEIIDVTRKI